MQLNVSAYGIQQSTDGWRDRLDQELAYAARAEVHLWAAVLTHKISEQALDNISNEPLLLDVESMLNQPIIGCLVCEEPYSDRMRRRKCPGEPKR